MRKRDLEVDHALAAASNYFLLAVGVFFGSGQDTASFAIITFVHLAAKGTVRMVISNHLLEMRSKEKIKMHGATLCLVLSLFFSIVTLFVPNLAFKDRDISLIFVFLSVFLSFFGEVKRLLMISEKSIFTSIRIQIYQVGFLLLALSLMIGSDSYSRDTTVMIFFFGYIISGVQYVVINSSNTFIDISNYRNSSFWSNSLILNILLSVLSFVPPIYVSFIFSAHLQGETVQIYQSSNIWFIPLSFLLNVNYLEAVSNSSDISNMKQSNKRFFRWLFLLMLVASTYGLIRKPDGAYFFGIVLISLMSVISLYRQTMNITLVKKRQVSRILIAQLVYVLIVLALSSIFEDSKMLLAIHIIIFFAEIVALTITRYNYKKVDNPSE